MAKPYQKPSATEKRATALSSAVIGVSHGGEKHHHWHGIPQKMREFLQSLSPVHSLTVPGDKGEWISYFRVRISDDCTFSALLAQCREHGIFDGPYFGWQGSGRIGEEFDPTGAGSAPKRMRRAAALAYRSREKELDLAHVLTVVFEGKHTPLPQWTLEERLRCFCASKQAQLPIDWNSNRAPWIDALLKWEARPEAALDQMEHWLTTELDNAADTNQMDEYRVWHGRLQRLARLRNPARQAALARIVDSTSA
jgi:hypothetical protein